MIEEISIYNKTLNQTILFNKSEAGFLLDNDNAIDWGYLNASISDYHTVSRVGVGVNNVEISEGRNISIVGWLIDDSYGTIEEKKKLLNTFCNPLDDIVIYAGQFKISGSFSQTVQYSKSNKENNDIICKFMLRIFCADPLFTYHDPQEATSYEVYQQLFTFPLVWLTGEDIVFGIRPGLDDFTLENTGTLSTGFEAYLTVNAAIAGVTITNTTTGKSLKLKSSVTFESGDIIYINTVFGARVIKVGQSLDSLTNAFQVLDLTSEFVEVIPGQNNMSVTVDTGDIGSIDARFYIEPLFYALEEQ